VTATDSWRGPALLTKHARVLVEIARDPSVRIRDLAQAAGVTERTALTLVSDLVTAGYLTRARVGRRSHYTVQQDALLGHPSFSTLRIGPCLELLAAPPATPAVPTGVGSVPELDLPKELR
jgi:hypothetical protein